MGVSAKDIQDFMGHVVYLATCVTTGLYTDMVYRGHDKAARHKVMEKGVKRF